LWNRYAKGAEGIAVQSTYRRLSDSFRNYDETNTFAGLVDYIDHENAHISLSNALEPVVHKNVFFRDERELRVVLMKDINKELNKRGNSSKDLYLEFPTTGCEVKVDIHALIEKVVVSPKAAKWFFALVESITKNYGFDFEVVESKNTPNS